MTLLVDIGNTNLKWARLEDGNQGPVRKSFHDADFDKRIAPVWKGLQPPLKLLVASVAGDVVNDALSRWVEANWNIEPVFVRSAASALGVTNAYERPAELGVDRWLSLLAVHQLFAQPALIVDCGTAVTFDVLDGDGRHLGGMILPGLDMMRQSLFDRTRIPPVQVRDTADLLGIDTASGIAAGSLQSILGLIDRVIEIKEAEIGGKMLLIITGSDGPRLAGNCQRQTRLEADLVIQGLALLADAGAST